MTVAILRQVCDLGYVVVFRAGADGLELVALEPATQRATAVRVDEGGEQGLYHAACELAERVGIDLRDG